MCVTHIVYTTLYQLSYENLSVSQFILFCFDVGVFALGGSVWNAVRTFGKAFTYPEDDVEIYHEVVTKRKRQSPRRFERRT